jgi:hypothetical protein
MGRTGFEIDVGFVKNNNGVPLFGVAEESKQVLFECLGLLTQIGGRETEQRSTCILGHRFCSRKKAVLACELHSVSTDIPAVRVFPVPGGP